MSETEAETEAAPLTDEERLQKDLEKQISLFARFFALLDSDVDGESQAALKKLKSNMEKINELQLKLSGQRGALNFATLLEKIENGSGGGGADVAAYEAVIEEFKQANEELKLAEALLREELERYRLLVKYGTSGATTGDFQKLNRSVLTALDEALKRLQAVVAPGPEVADKIYEKVLDGLVTKDLGDADGNGLKFKHKLAAGVLRGMKYPVDATDAVKMQTVIAAQAQTLNDSQDLQERFALLCEVLPELANTLDVALHRTCAHPDLTAAIHALRSSVREADSLRESLATIRGEMQMDINALRGQVGALQSQLEVTNAKLHRVDTRMMRVMVAVAEGKDPLKILDPVQEEEFWDSNSDRKINKKKKSERPEKRAERVRNSAIDWSDTRALRERVSVLTARKSAIFLGDSRNTVTIADLLQDNYKLQLKKHVPQFATKDAYVVMPKRDVDALVNDSARLEASNNTLSAENASLSRTAQTAQRNSGALEVRIRELSDALERSENEVVHMHVRARRAEEESNYLRRSGMLKKAFMAVGGAVAGGALGLTIGFSSVDSVKQEPVQQKPHIQIEKSIKPR